MDDCPAGWRIGMATGGATREPRVADAMPAGAIELKTAEQVLAALKARKVVAVATTPG